MSHSNPTRSGARLRTVAVVGAAVLASAVLAGCGQKGPLFLPDQPKDVVTRPAPTSDAPPAEKRDDESKSSQKR